MARAEHNPERFRRSLTCALAHLSNAAGNPSDDEQIARWLRDAAVLIQDSLEQSKWNSTQATFIEVPVLSREDQARLLKMVGQGD